MKSNSVWFFLFVSLILEYPVPGNTFPDFQGAESDNGKCSGFSLDPQDFINDLTSCAFSKLQDEREGTLKSALKNFGEALEGFIDNLVTLAELLAEGNPEALKSLAQFKIFKDALAGLANIPGDKFLETAREFLINALQTFNIPNLNEPRVNNQFQPQQNYNQVGRGNELMGLFELNKEETGASEVEEVQTRAQKAWRTGTQQIPYWRPRYVQNYFY